MKPILLSLEPSSIFVEASDKRLKFAAALSGCLSVNKQGLSRGSTRAPAAPMKLPIARNYRVSVIRSHFLQVLAKVRRRWAMSLIFFADASHWCVCHYFSGLCFLLCQKPGAPHFREDVSRMRFVVDSLAVSGSLKGHKVYLKPFNRLLNRIVLGLCECHRFQSSRR